MATTLSHILFILGPRLKADFLLRKWLCVEGDGAGGDAVAPAHGDEVCRAGAGADEVDGHVSGYGV